MNPVLFLGHGSPMNLVIPSDFTRSLEEFGSKLGGVKNILVVSPHWKTRGTYVTVSDLDSWFGEEALRLASRFDNRNGNDSYMKNLGNLKALHELAQKQKNHSQENNRGI